MSFNFWAPPCIHCGEDSWSLLCQECVQILSSKRLCEICGVSLAETEKKRCFSCRESREDPIRFSFPFEDSLSKWIRSLKSSYRKASSWKELQSLPIQAPNQDPPFNILSFVPSDPQNTKKRGYDCSRELAEILAKKWGLGKPVELFFRKPFLKSQKEMPRAERKLYISKTLGLKPGLEKLITKESSVILIDDVATSGASLRYCGSLLKKAKIPYALYSLCREGLSRGG